MKKGLLALLTVSTLVLLTACGLFGDPDPESVSVDPNNVTIEVGQTETVEVAIDPEDAIQDVEWASADEDIATVDDGTITGIAKGETTITATSTEDEELSATVQVEVLTAAQSVQEVWDLEEDEDVHTSGVVTDITDHRTFFIEDDTRAIAVYDSEDEGIVDDLEIGDEVQIFGVRDAFAMDWWDSDYSFNQIGEPEVTVLDSDQELPDSVDIEDVDLEDESEMVEYQGHRIDQRGLLVDDIDEDDHGNIDVYLERADDGAEIQIRYDSRLADSDAAADALLDLKEGNMIDIFGMTLGWFDGPQLAYSSADTFVEPSEMAEISLPAYENNELDLRVTDNVPLSYELLPEQEVEVTSDDEDVVVVEFDEEEGAFFANAVGPGEATVTFDPVDADPVDLHVSVRSLEIIAPEELEVQYTEAVSIDWMVDESPALFPFQDITYEVEDEDIAKVEGVYDEDDEGNEVQLDVQIIGQELDAPATTEVTITSVADPSASATITVEVVEPEPTITVPEIIPVELGEEYDVLQDVTAEDVIDGDLTDDIVLVDDDDFDYNEEGDYEITVSVENSYENVTEATFTVSVQADAATFADGFYNFRFTSPEFQNRFFAHAERYLMETQYGGVPVMTDAGAVAYSDRLDLVPDEAIPLMNWGVAFAEMTEDDSNVIMDDGDPGEEGEYTLRQRLTGDPDTFHQWIYDDANSSDMITLFQDSLYYFTFDDFDDPTGFDLVPGMADGMPNPIDEEELDVGMTVAHEWHIDIRDDLEWYLHEDIEEDYSTDITAEDFIDTYKLALDEGWFRAVTGGGDFFDPGQRIVNAEEYYEGEVVWEDVGLWVEDDHTLGFEFEYQMDEWDVIYWLSSFVMTPIHLELYGDVGDSYGTSHDTIAAHGPYYISYYEPDSIIRFRENPNFHDPDRYSITGRDVRIIEDTEIAFEEFLDGTLDAATIPGARYEEFVDADFTHLLPGATTFRINFNALGTPEGQREEFPASTYEPEPILAHEDFQMAMFHALNREVLAEEVLVTNEPQMYYFSEAYVVDPREGTPFRNAPLPEDMVDEENEIYTWGEWVGEGLGRDTYGYMPDLATDMFLSALEDKVDEGFYEADDTIELDLHVFAGSEEQLNFGEFVKESFEDNFYCEDNDIGVVVNVTPTEFPDIYYNYMMTGDFDLAIGGISGSTLDAASFLDVFSEDNRGGFTINWGIDTSTANIEIEYEDPETGEERRELWSFDAIVEVLRGEVYLEFGEEATPPEDPEED